MIRKATNRDLSTLAHLALCLWPNHTLKSLTSELADVISKETAAFFLVFKAGQTIGFAQCQLRFDYVEGTSSAPVGYLEGIFVKEAFRKQGHAQALLQECETWASANGCKEFASDCELNNRASLKFHLHLGFTESNRIICLVKKL